MRQPRGWHLYKQFVRNFDDLFDVSMPVTGSPALIQPACLAPVGASNSGSK